MPTSKGREGKGGGGDGRKGEGGGGEGRVEEWRERKGVRFFFSADLATIGMPQLTRQWNKCVTRCLL